MALSDALDKEIVSGTDGLLTGTNLPNNNVSAITSYDLFLAQFGFGRVDGRYAGISRRPSLRNGLRELLTSRGRLQRKRFRPHSGFGVGPAYRWGGGFPPTFRLWRRTSKTTSSGWACGATW